MAETEYSVSPFDEPDSPDREDAIAQPPEFVFDETDGNVAQMLGESEDGRETLKEVADLVRRHFDTDWESMEGWRTKCSKTLKLFAGQLPEKDFPWKDCANAHVPIVIENISRLQSRIMSEVFGDFVNVVGVMPVGQDDEETADIISMHDNWQFRNEISDFKRQMDRAVLSFLLHGDVVAASFYDEERQENRHEVLMPEEFVVPYSFVTTRPDLSDLPRYTWVKRVYRHTLEAMRERWANVEKVLDAPSDSWESEPDAPTRSAMASHQKQDEPDGEEGAPHKLLHYEGWLKLPGQDRHRWCRVVLHYATKTVLWLSIIEEEDWRDRMRFERQLQELSVYRAARDAYDAAIGQSVLLNQVALRSLEDSEKGLSQLDPGALQIAEAPLIPPGMMPPPAPGWMNDPEDRLEKPEPPKKRQICMFSHGVCLENLVGATGLGVGEILADFNRAADTALCQFTDAATLGNCSGILTSQSVNMEGHVWRPGKITKIQGVSGSDLKSNIMELRAPPANAQLLNLVENFGGYAQNAVQSPDVLSGDPGKSGETFRGLNSRIEQATKQLTTYALRFSVFLKQIYENNARLNATFLPEYKLLELKNEMTGVWRKLEVGRKLYERDYRVEIRSDLKFTSEAQRVAEADQLVQMPAAVPALQQNLAFQYATVRAALAARGKWDLIAKLGAPPPAPETFGMPSAMPVPPGPPPGGAAPPPTPGQGTAP